MRNSSFPKNSAFEQEADRQEQYRQLVLGKIEQLSDKPADVAEKFKVARQKNSYLDNLYTLLQDLESALDRNQLDTAKTLVQQAIDETYRSLY